MKNHKIGIRKIKNSWTKICNITFNVTNVDGKNGELKRPNPLEQTYLGISIERLVSGPIGVLTHKLTRRRVSDLKLFHLQPHRCPPATIKLQPPRTIRRQSKQSFKVNKTFMKFAPIGMSCKLWRSELQQGINHWPKKLLKLNTCQINLIHRQ